MKISKVWLNIKSKLRSGFKVVVVFDVILAPILYIKPQINGNVIGLPTNVPSNAATKFPLIKYAKITASKKWRPNKGVNETIDPQAKPDEIA